MERKPISKQNSPWIEVPAHPMIAQQLGAAGGTKLSQHQRRVSDGVLAAIVSYITETEHQPELGWHLSISFRNHKGELTRYPRWDEIAHARDALLPADTNFMMMLPTSDEYVALHDTTFHIHEYPAPWLTKLAAETLLE